MQPKVSIAMPCYNKAQYIGKMFDSIIAQKWDNIELILVNDGSTDGTREVIADYEPRFRERGYELVIIDQENAGVCAAAKAGLERVTGDYVCCVDADDMLDTEYVSLPVSFLEENWDYDYTACSRQSFTTDEKGRESFHSIRKYSENQKISPETYMLDANTEGAPWAYMLRFEYLKKCRIAETYFTDTKGSHEPGFTIPLTAFGGKIKFLNEKPLYLHNCGRAEKELVEGSHSRHDTPEGCIAHRNEYFKLCDIAISALPEEVSNAERKARLKKICELGRLISTINTLSWKFAEIKTIWEEIGELREKILIEIINFVNDYLCLQYPIKRFHIPQGREYIFIQSVQSYFCGMDINTLENLNFREFSKRIIFYGILGKRGEHLLPVLLKFDIPQIEFWDKNGGNFRVKQPNFSELNEDDMFVIVPANKEVIENIKRSLKNSKCNNIVLYGVGIKYIYMYVYHNFSRKIPDET
jgi:glycosyltransferase involved in cell wall biosynthesis